MDRPSDERAKPRQAAETPDAEDDENRALSASAAGTAARLGPRRPLQEALLLATVVFLLAGLDQCSKGYVVDRLGPLERDWSGRLRPPPGTRPIEVIPGAFRLTITGNEGAIWGLGRSLGKSFKRPFFIGLSLLASLFVLYLMIRSSRPQWLRRLGLAAVLSGALGNLIDRIRLDYVIDFADWHLGFNWPTFNVADVAITIGVILVIIDLYWHPDERSEAEQEGPKPEGPEQEEPAAAE
jgi:signal peptidase II